MGKNALIRALLRHPNCNYIIKLDVADQKYGHGKERALSKKTFLEEVNTVEQLEIMGMGGE